MKKQWPTATYLTGALVVGALAPDRPFEFWILFALWALSAVSNLRDEFRGK